MPELGGVPEREPFPLFVDAGEDKMFQISAKDEEGNFTKNTVSVAGSILGAYEPARTGEASFYAHDLRINQQIKVSVAIKELSEVLGISKEDIEDANECKFIESIIRKFLSQSSVAEENIPPGITEKEVNLIKNYYEANKKELEGSSENVHIRKTKENGLPRSLINVPKGSFKGLYVLLKTHDNLTELGLGSENIVTYAFQLQSRELYAYRSGRATGVKKQELEISKNAIQHSDCLVGGESVYYKGPFRSRIGFGPNEIYPRRLDQNKTIIEREEDVEKVGLIMPFAWNGDLTNYIENKKVDDQLLVKITKAILNSFIVMHEQLNIVHRDIKPENIMVDYKEDPKVADFGYAKNIGEKAGAQGTAGYLPPEAAECVGNLKTYTADPSLDIWALGSTLAHLAYQTTWFEINGQQHGEWQLMATHENVENLKAGLFASQPEKSILEPIIDACLQFNSAERKTARKLMAIVEDIELDLSKLNK